MLWTTLKKTIPHFSKTQKTPHSVSKSLCGVLFYGKVPEGAQTFSMVMLHSLVMASSTSSTS